MRSISQRLIAVLLVVSLSAAVGCESDSSDEAPEAEETAESEQQQQVEESDDDGDSGEASDGESDETADDEETEGVETESDGEESDGEDEEDADESEGEEESAGEDSEGEDEESADEDSDGDDAESEEGEETAEEGGEESADGTDFEEAQRLGDLDTYSGEEFENLPIRAEGPVAVVDGEEVPAVEFNVIAQQQLAGVPAESVQPQAQRMKQMLLQGAIAGHLVEREIQEQGVEVTDAEIDQAIEEFEKMMEAQSGDQMGEMRSLMEQQGLDDAALRQQAEQQLAAEKLLGDSGDLEVTEEEVRQHYEENKQQFQLEKPQVRARHILLNVEDHEEGESNADEVRQRAEELRGQVGTTSEEFAEVARNHSDGPSASRGGDLGYITQDQLMPEFTDAAFSMEPGEISEPVRSDLGWHIIRVEDRRDEGGPSFEEVRENLRMSLEAQKLQQAAAQLVQRLRQEAEIETREDNIVVDG